MTLKEELEILRGEPIQVFDGDPMDIPCIETSDPEKLCKNPVVSVNMITYNHEPYIRQAIEGVMMQKTDFEFELIIGEDCSQDKTREICFEYQKKYPDKIRVLWWHENVSKLGGNSRRVRAHSRGEFIALCEGDDYWIDPLKLQKQVDVMRKHPNVGICFCGVDQLMQSTGQYKTYTRLDAPTGIVSGLDVLKALVLDVQYPPYIIRQANIETSGILARVAAYKAGCDSDNGLRKMRFRFGDTIFIEECVRKYDAYFSSDSMSVYRKHQGGVTHSKANLVAILHDAMIVKIFQACSIYGWSITDSIDYFSENIFHSYKEKLLLFAQSDNWSSVHATMRQICSWPLRRVFFRPKNVVLMFVVRLGLLRFAFFQHHLTSGRRYLLKGLRYERLQILKKYKELNTRPMIFCGK